MKALMAPKHDGRSTAIYTTNLNSKEHFLLRDLRLSKFSEMKLCLSLITKIRI